MSIPTPQQDDVLNCNARVRVVRSAPGSGKTWLVAELIRRELCDRHSPINGIAALSFTHVGGDEIRKAVGYELGHPHFVGTIDAFLFRYVVRPFLTKCFPAIGNPRLIPGEWGPTNWTRFAPSSRATVGSEGVNLFGCVFIDESNHRAVVACKPHPAQPLRRLAGPDLSQVLKSKEQMWERTGILTHSDAALWASRVLCQERFGAMVRAEIVRRFPLIIVDELQDTGYFLGKSICLLLAESSSRGVLVGDPDQAIFEFNGARPDLFQTFEAIDGAVTLPLSASRRCAPAVATAASHLKDSGGSFQPDRSKDGHAILVRYDDLDHAFPLIVSEIKRAKGKANVKIIARANSTVIALVGRNAKAAPKLGSPPLNHIQRAVVSFRQSRNVEALAASRAALESTVFGHEGVNDEQLEKVGIDPSEWRRLAIECLLTSNALDLSHTIYDWQIEVGKLLDSKLAQFHLPPSLQLGIVKLKPQQRGSEWNQPCSHYIPSAVQPSDMYSTIPVTTVHSVKGETHDITVFVCPDTTSAHCPSALWWSAKETDREEKRIAFVAMTRTRGDLIVCVSQNCYQRLLDNRPGFVSSFENMAINEFVVQWPKSYAATKNAVSAQTSTPST